jgi:mono/diheme cytochrome c family protein
MRRCTARALLALAVAGSPVLAITSQGGTGADPVLAKVGAEHYVQYCAACHGVTGKGNGPAAGELRTPPADLTQIAARGGGDFPDYEIARYIDGRFVLPAHGSREMPVWGRRFGERIVDGASAEEVVRGQLLILVEYLKSIQEAELKVPANAR